MKPYTMCTEQECRERSECHEISVFEQSDRDGQPDSRKVVAKYRRSAAGSKQRTPRTMEQLKVTVHYLIEFLFKESHSSGKICLSAVHFFEDRIRAVQVDLTRHQDFSSCAELQVIMARAQIMILYLTSSIYDEEASSSGDRYERKFGFKALQTALSGYFASQSTNWGDEMTAYSILVLLNEKLRTDASLVANGNVASSTFHTVWFETTRLARCHGDFGPQSRWAVQMLSRVCLGEWQQALVQLNELNVSTMTHCCIDDCARGYLRWKTLQTFNMVLSKGQTIAIPELNRLLCIGQLPPEPQTFKFAAVFGLPKTDDESKVIFKQAAILPPTDLSRCILPREVLDGKGHEQNHSEPNTGLAPLILGCSRYKDVIYASNK